MARPLRMQNEGGWYHVINRGIDRSSIYRDERDRKHFLEVLENASGMQRLEVHGYVLMGNHYHLIVRVPEGNLSQAMQWVNVSYSVWFNRRHERIGPLFQGRFKSVPVENGGWLYQLSQYVHLNPVRVRWLGLDKRGRRLEGLGLKGVESAEEAAVADDNYIPTSTTIIIRHGRMPEGMLLRGKEGLVDGSDGPAGKEVDDGISKERTNWNGGLEGGYAPRDGQQVCQEWAVAV